MMSFDGDTFNRDYVVNPPAAVASGDAQSYILDDFRVIDDPAPGQAIGDINAKETIGGMPVANVGGAVTNTNTQVIEITTDPFTGQKVKRKVFVKTRLRRSGETVLREDLLGD